jgi:predicted HicB family RNase H-like nuclease
MKKDLDYYLQLPYTFTVKRWEDEPEPYFESRVLELDGCQSHGSTEADALKNLKEAMHGWIETKLANGFEVPEPNAPNEYSGKFLLRLPKSLHRNLAISAEKEGVSLNQYALYKLSS